MSYNIFYLIILLLISNLIHISKSEENFNLQNFLDWCGKNDIVISPKIKITFENGELNAKALEDIPSKTEIVNIPEKMILTVDTIMDELNSPELRAQYDKFQQLEVESYKEMNDELHKDEIFLTYLLYLMKHEEEKYNNTEFYKTFKGFFPSVEQYLPNSPLFFTNEQKEFLSGTYFGSFAKEIRKTIDKHINILKNSSFYNKDIDPIDFIQKRLFVHSRGYDTTRKELGEIIIAPLYTLFPFDNVRSNARLDFKYKKGAKIMTTFEIKKGKDITVFGAGKKNVEKIVFEGRINSYLTSSRENHLIPAFSPYLYYKYDIDDIKLIELNYFNLADNLFQKHSQDFYKDHSNVFKVEQATNLWACKTLEENLKYYKEYIEDLMQRVDELFKGENEEKINTMNKALKNEWTELNQKYEKTVEICEYEKKKELEHRTEDL